MSKAGIDVEHVQKRERSILAFFATSLASRGLGIGCQLLQVPIALHHLGNEAFGLWVTLFSLGFVLAFTDFGIGLGVQNKIAEALGKNDVGGARRIFVTGLAFLVGVMFLLLGAAFVASHFVDLPKLLRIDDPAVAAETGPAVFAVAIVWCLNVPLGLGQRLAYGAQLGWAHNIAQTVSQVVLLATVAIGASMRLGLTVFSVFTFASAALVNLCFFLYLMRRLGWMRLSIRQFDASLLRELAHLGIFFFLQQISTIVLFTAPPIILSASVGAAEVTPFNLTQRVLNLFMVVANALLLPMWPAYADAKARNDWVWIRRTLWRSVGLVSVLTILPMFAVGPFVPQLIHWWTQGEAALPKSSLVWLLVAWNAITVLQQPFGYFLSGISRVRRATLYAFLSTVTALTAITLLLPRFGVNGIPLGLIAGFIPFILFGNVLETIVVLHGAPRPGSARNPASKLPAAHRDSDEPTQPPEAI